MIGRFASAMTSSASLPFASRFNRRDLVLGGGVLLALAGCQTAGPPMGGDAVVSADGLSYFNAFRAAQGLSAMNVDSRLERAALQQAGYMAKSGKMEHTTGWGRDFASRVKDNGIEGAASENIAAGRMDTARVFSMWENSPPHRRNMADPRFSRFGLAYVARGDQRYWALVMGR